MASASTSVLVPLETYLKTVYRPDCDWLDGQLKERNMGESPHATVQGFLAFIFRGNAGTWNIRSFPEQRVQTSALHYRVVDLCVVRRETPFEPIVRTAPLLCVEILSRDDPMSEIEKRVEDYFGMGVGTFWVIDPRRRRAYHAQREGQGASSMRDARELLTVPGTPIEVSLAEMFAELDDLEAKL
jgi:Uma2 family endonuclease